MSSQLTINAEALRLFFTEEVYLVKDKAMGAAHETTAVNLHEVEPKPEAALPSRAEITWDFQFLGENEKGILILVNDHEYKVSSPQGTELLRKLVKAIQLTNKDFALVNYAHYKGATWDVLQGFFNCRRVLCFGVEAPHLGLADAPLHQLIKLAGIHAIFTTNLHDLDTDLASKKMLWGALKNFLT